MSAKGIHDPVIRDAIAAGLHLGSAGELRRASGVVLNGTMTKKGYRVISLGAHPRAQVTVARVVCWLAHGEPPTPSHQVDHINRNRADDRPDNLRWATVSENVLNISETALHKRRQYARRMGLKARGEGNPKCKLTVEQVCAIRLSYPQRSQVELAQSYGVTRTTVNSIIRGATWSHLSAAIAKAQPE